MAIQNAINLSVANNADGFEAAGGTTARRLTVTGADITLTGSGANVYTFPASTDTLVGRDSGDILTNKTIVETWTEVLGTSQALAINSNYILNNAGLVTATLPVTAAVGSRIRIVGKGAGGWKIAQNASQFIVAGALTTTVGVGGYLASKVAANCIELLCTTADNGWTVVSSEGLGYESVTVV